MNYIEFKNVTKRYQHVTALDRVNLKIPRHRILVIVGPSGSGKTTLLRLINRLIPPTSGRILLNNQLLSDYPLKRFRLKTGNLLQKIALFPNLTVDQNITVQLKILHVPPQSRLKVARQLLEQVGLSAASGRRYPRALSGGEQQRVGVARALAIRPPLILMDEPFSALDPINRKKLQDLVLRLHRRLNNTIVFVTHNMPEALKMGQRIAVLYHGKIVQTGTARELLQRPRSPLVNRLFHRNSIRDVIEKGDAQPLRSSLRGQEVSVNKSIPQLARLLKARSKIDVSYRGRIWRVTVSDLLTFIGDSRGSEYE